MGDALQILGGFGRPVQRLDRLAHHSIEIDQRRKNLRHAGILLSDRGGDLLGRGGALIDRASELPYLFAPRAHLIHAAPHALSTFASAFHRPPDSPLDPPAHRTHPTPALHPPRPHPPNP